MRVLISVSSIQFFRFSFLVLHLLTMLLASGCSVTRIYHEVPPSQKALSGINSLHVVHFQGERSELFSKILIHEINQLSRLKYLAVYPDISIKKAAVLSAEVRHYSVLDKEEMRHRTHISLVEHGEMQENSAGLDIFHHLISFFLVKDERPGSFEFVEKPYNERIIHRTLELEIAFKIKDIAGEKTLYSNSENASLQQSYSGEENILLIPDARDEMTRIAQLLIQKFLDGINPEPIEHVGELEKGTSPLPWTMGLLDFGHPQIIRSNHFATGSRYDLALKGWNYVLFEPRVYHKSERFIFTDDVYTRLKKADLPHTTLQPLLEIHEKSFAPDEINVVLLGLIPNQDFERYAQIIKSHARISQNIDRLNLAAAHYNLGTVYHLQNKLELAAYHFAQANAYNPHERYSQAWTDLQHLQGDYNPLDTLMDRSVESAGKRPPPEDALLQPKT
ncbi:MAG: tetratricopeptide repeat protein [SAR324 cluster bacterium]|nr:tetratricopeptide repeat protein [SAR324 cluster bacterium]